MFFAFLCEWILPYHYIDNWNYVSNSWLEKTLPEGSFSSFFFLPYCLSSSPSSPPQPYQPMTFTRSCCHCYRDTFKEFVGFKLRERSWKKISGFNSWFCHTNLLLRRPFSSVPCCLICFFPTLSKISDLQPIRYSFGLMLANNSRKGHKWTSEHSFPMNFSVSIFKKYWSLTCCNRARHVKPPPWALSAPLSTVVSPLHWLSRAAWLLLLSGFVSTFHLGSKRMECPPYDWRCSSPCSK